MRSFASYIEDRRMNSVHIHLMLNHVPLFGSVVTLLLLALGIWRQSDELKRVAFAMIVLTSLLTLPVYFTGEPAENAVRRLPTVTQAAMEVHEDAAKIAFAGMLVTGAVALVGLVLFQRRKPVPSWLTTMSLVASLVTALLMARAANLGGKIRHSELAGVLERSYVSTTDSSSAGR